MRELEGWKMSLVTQWLCEHVRWLSFRLPAFLTFLHLSSVSQETSVLLFFALLTVLCVPLHPSPHSSVFCKEIDTIEKDIKFINWQKLFPSLNKRHKKDAVVNLTVPGLWLS